MNAVSSPLTSSVFAPNPFAPSYSPSEGIDTPDSYRSGAPSEYRCCSGAPPHLLVGCIREESTGKPIPSIVELWHGLELEEGTFGFSYPERSKSHPWDADWRGRISIKIRGGFAVTLSHPSSDQKVRPVFLRVSSPGFESIVVETFPEPWSDISSVEVVLRREQEGSQ